LEEAGYSKMSEPTANKRSLSAPAFSFLDRDLGSLDLSFFLV
jgi:hypothetical protein